MQRICFTGLSVCLDATKKDNAAFQPLFYEDVGQFWGLPRFLGRNDLVLTPL